jgi:pimeloyl-ACP methyl ester carboxylesterase
MHAVDFQTAKTKRDVDEQMSHLLPVADRQFVISNNLAAESAQLRWRANHKTLADHSEAEVLAWDVPDQAQTDLPALFIGGGQSTRLTDPAYLARLHAHFTNAKVEMIPDAAHFPHATHAPQTAVMMVNFLAGSVLAARISL